MFHPVRALLRKRGYRKVTPIDKLTREDLERMRAKQPRESWDDVALASPTRHHGEPSD